MYWYILHCLSCGITFLGDAEMQFENSLECDYSTILLLFIVLVPLSS